MQHSLLNKNLIKFHKKENKKKNRSIHNRTQMVVISLCYMYCKIVAAMDPITCYGS